MKNLTLAEFKGNIDTVLKEIILEGDICQVADNNLNSFVIMSKEEYDIHHEALKMLLTKQ